MQNIKNFIKNHDQFGMIFLFLGKIAYCLLDFITPNRKKKIIFVCFSGRQCGDSPLKIYESIKKNHRLKEYELYWAFNHPKEFKEVTGCKKLNINSLSFLYHLLSASVWISNASIEKMIPYKPKGVIYINTWHGIPWKKIGSDEKNVSYLVKNWYKKVHFDLLTACSSYDQKIFSTIFPNSKAAIKIIGLPRNDELYQPVFDKKKILNKLKISKNKKIILYAPTFREYQEENPANFSIFERLSSEYVILYRGHYFEEQLIQNFPMKASIINVSNYYYLNDLMVISDCLVTDYSSLLFDYALLEKPILLFPYDYEKYQQNRGSYIGLEELGLKRCFTSVDFVEALETNREELVKKSKELKKKYHKKLSKTSTEEIIEFLLKQLEIVAY